MKKILFSLAMAVVAICVFAALADAVMIRNVSNQVLIIPMPGKGPLQLAPTATANITDAELRTNTVQNLIRNGQVKVVTAGDTSTGTVMIRNVTDQVLLVQIPGKGTLQLAPNATATLTQGDYNSPSVQNFVRNGQIRIATAQDRPSTVMIRNMSNQALFIPIPGKGTLQLAPNATATLTQQDFNSMPVQNLLRNGQIATVRPGPPRGFKVGNHP